jgi:hypothetical protein
MKAEEKIMACDRPINKKFNKGGKLVITPKMPKPPKPMKPSKPSKKKG